MFLQGLFRRCVALQEPTVWNGIWISEYAYWHWQARLKKPADPQSTMYVELMDVGSGEITLPQQPHYPLWRQP